MAVRIVSRCARASPTRSVVTHTANLVPLKAGEAFEYAFGGGGGWGDPLERDPQRVCEDVLDEYVTPEGARRDYGVVLRGSLEALDLTVDLAATQRLRETQRASSDAARPRSGRAASRRRAKRRAVSRRRTKS